MITGIAPRCNEKTRKLSKQARQYFIQCEKSLVEFANQVSESSNSITMAQFSKVIKDENIKLGRNKLFEWFRKNEYLRHNNEPYQRYMKYFDVKETIYETPYGTKVNVQTFINGLGQIYFVEKLRKEFCK